MTASDKFNLIGLADPSGASLGLLVPLFTDGRSNAPLVQLITTDGTLAGVEPYEVPDAARLPAPQLTLELGEPAIHAVGFGQNDVLIVGSEADRAALLKRMDDPSFLKRPLLAMEIASLLKRDDLRDELAARAHADMSQNSIETANRWRDLSVLTSSLRRALAVRPERSARQLAETVVARVRRDAVEILGTSKGLSASQHDVLGAAVRDAIASFAKLYPPPPEGWRVQVRRKASHRRSEPDAAVLLATRRANTVDRSVPWPSIPDMEVYYDDKSAFTRTVEESSIPLFVVYDADDPGSMHRAAGDWTVREMHGISLGSPRAAHEASSQPWSSTYVPTPGMGGSGGSTRSLMGAVRLAVAAELDRRAHSSGSRLRTATLLRSRGLQPDPESDGWASLYDRAWSMGLAPWRSICIPGQRSVAVPSALEPGWAAQALFDTPEFLRGPLLDQVMEQTRTTAALLVDNSPHSSEDLVRHRRSVTRLLQPQQWRISDDDFGRPEDQVEVEGRVARFNIRVATPGDEPRKVRYERILDLDLRDVSKVVVTCAAGPGAVLTQLATSGELAVDMRDLVGFDAAHSTVLTLVGAQLRRAVTGMPSPSRTRLIALIARQAFIADRVEGEMAAKVRELTKDPDLTERAHLVLRSVRSVGSSIVAEVRMLDPAEHDGSSSFGSEVGRFVMTVSPQEVTISAMP